MVPSNSSRDSGGSLGDSIGCTVGTTVVGLDEGVGSVGIELGAVVGA
jgi:hypothetical protein